MVTNRLNWYVEKYNLFNINQAGFRKKRSTIEQLIKLSDEVQKAVTTKKYVLGVFLDIEKAYGMAERGLV
jgi:c-di-GMP-related signal transduction protein